jgi:hypothetical protein
MQSIKQSAAMRETGAWGIHCEVGYVLIFDVLGTRPTGYGATEAEARKDARDRAKALNPSDPEDLQAKRTALCRAEKASLRSAAS